MIEVDNVALRARGKLYGTTSHESECKGRDIKLLVESQGLFDLVQGEGM